MKTALATVTPAAPAQVEADLRRAAEFVLRNGLHRGSNYDAKQSAEGTRPRDCRVDIIGALRIAIFDTPIPGELNESKDARYGAALEHVTAWVRYAYGLRLFAWFDRARNTAEDTAADLRSAAAWRPDTHR